MLKTISGLILSSRCLAFRFGNLDQRCNPNTQPILTKYCLASNGFGGIRCKTNLKLKLRSNLVLLVNELLISIINLVARVCIASVDLTPIRV